MSHQPATFADNQPQFYTNSDNVNNNQHHAGANPAAAFSHSPAAPPTTMQAPYFEAIRTYAVNNGHQDGKPLQYQPPLATTTGYQLSHLPPVTRTAATAAYQTAQHTFMPSPSTSPMQLPPPPHSEVLADDLYTSSQQKNLPAPPTITSYDSNFNRQAPEQLQTNYQQSSWPQQNVPAAPSPFVANKSPQNWQPIRQQQNYKLPQGPPTNFMPAAFNPPATESFHNHQAFRDYTAQETPKSFAHGSSASFFENRETTPSVPSSQPEPFAPFPMASFAPSTSPSVQPSKQGNVEIVQPDAAQMRQTPVAQADSFYPENRERLDDVSTPPSSSSTSFTDRHNYLVTGQLSQERPVLPPPQQQLHQVHFEESTNIVEQLPPPGLSRMVVGQPETNREQVASTADVLPPGLNRMVPGTEMSSPNYMNYQRQADGEVAQAPPLAMQRPQSNSPFVHHQQNTLDDSHQSFNTSDRNLYLVAGESDANNQRVIPGVESDSHLPPSILHPMQNLHIQDDDDFVNVSVSNQERNVNVDGMETFPEPQQHRAIDTELREEDIDGANDNSESFNAVPLLHVPDHGVAGVVITKPESDVREEAIEGANDYNDEIAKSTISKKLKPEIGLSSEDSELRELEKSKSKPKPRRSKKYADDSNDSEHELSDDHRRRQNREKMSREDYEKYRRKEKERTSGDRPRRNDDTDGSKYGDSRRRTDDDDDYRNQRGQFKKSSRQRNQDIVEPDDKEKKRREKYRESGSRRSKKTTQTFITD